MPSLVIKNLPEEVHRKLKETAKREHRSMIQQAIVLLERGLEEVPRLPQFKPVKGAFPVTDTFINKAKRKGRK